MTDTENALEDALRAWVAEHQGGAIMTDFMVIAASISPGDDEDVTRYSTFHGTCPWHVTAGLLRYATLSLEDDLHTSWDE